MEILIVVIILAVLAKAFLFNDIGLKQVTIEDDCFYFRNKNKPICFEEIEKIDLLFESSSNNHRAGKSTHYHTNLSIKLKDKRLPLLLSETTHRNSFWAIIQACHNYNLKDITTNHKIICARIIPESEEALMVILTGWRKQRKDVLNMIESVFTHEYAMDNHITYKEAEHALGKLKRNTMFAFIALVFIGTIILILLNGVTFHIT